MQLTCDSITERMINLDDQLDQWPYAARDQFLGIATFQEKVHAIIHNLCSSANSSSSTTSSSFCSVAASAVFEEVDYRAELKERIRSDIFFKLFLIELGHIKLLY